MQDFLLGRHDSRGHAVWGANRDRPSMEKLRRPAPTMQAIEQAKRAALCDGRLGDGACPNYDTAGSTPVCRLFAGRQVGCCKSPRESYVRALVTGGWPNVTCRWATTKVTVHELVNAGLIRLEN